MVRYPDIIYTPEIDSSSSRAAVAAHCLAFVTIEAIFISSLISVHLPLPLHMNLHQYMHLYALLYDGTTMCTTVKQLGNQESLLFKDYA